MALTLNCFVLPSVANALHGSLFIIIIVYHSHMCIALIVRLFETIHNYYYYMEGQGLTSWYDTVNPPAMSFWKTDEYDITLMSIICLNGFCVTQEVLCLTPLRAHP